uniref:Uncharacterized protein n=1 Tax=Avena sativa TaxID=4498 RepID=A0ACD5WG51_AVESA
MIDLLFGSSLNQPCFQEKHKEKKHKKDKKDKDKKEGKEKKDKERSKDKHRDKKDRKEKHKDKKKDKSKDKSKESEGTESHGEAILGQKVGESSRKAEEIKDPIFREELVRKTQDGKGLENRGADTFPVPIERNREGFSAAPALEKERTAVNKMRIHSIDTSRKTEGLGQQTITINQQRNGTSIQRGENFNSSSQGARDGFVTAPMVEKERVKVTRPLSNSNDSAARKEGMGQRINNISILVQKRTESPNKEIAKKEMGTSSPLHRSPADAMHKGNGKVGRPMDSAQTSTQRFSSPSTSGTSTGMDRSLPRSTIPSPSITIRRPNGMVRPPESFSISTNKSNAGDLSSAMDKEKGPVGRMLQNNVSTDQKLVGFKPPAVGREKEPGGRMLQNDVSTDQKLVGSKPPAVGREKEMGGRMLQNHVSTDQKLVDSKPPAVEKVAVGRVEKEKGPVGRMLQNNVSTDQKLVGFKPPAVGREKEPGGRMLQNDVSTDQKLVGSKAPAVGREKEPGGRMLQNDVSAVQKLVGSKPPAVGREKEMGGRMLQNHVSTDQKLVDSKPPAVEKVAVGRVEKVRDGAVDDKKKEDKKRDRHEKKKRKEKDKHREKKKEKEAKKEKEEHNHKEHDKLRENSIDDQIDSLLTKLLDPPIAPPADDTKAILADENLKKRKNHEMNGYQQNHHEMRPTKLPRPAPSSNHVENGTASHVAAPLSSMPEAIKIAKAERLPPMPEAIKIEKAERLPKKEEKVNGNKEAQRPPIDSGLRDPLAASGNGAPSRKLSPHPDCKYLVQIYSIPEAPQMMMECEIDDQNWLFDQCGTQSQKPKTGTEADGAPQVWAEAVKIDQADVIALPYVIPF